MVFKRDEEQVKWGVVSSSIIFTFVKIYETIEKIYIEKYRKDIVLPWIRHCTRARDIVANIIGAVITLVEFANLSSECATKGEPQVLGKTNRGT